MNYDKEKITLLYQEYERLHSVVNSYAHSSFDDFKLLGSLGLVFAWAPLVKLFNGHANANYDPKVLLIGFVVTLIISTVIFTRDLLKQSLMIYNHLQLEAYEIQIVKLLKQEKANTFCGSVFWRGWLHNHHSYVAKSFYGLYSLVIIVFPCVVLCWFTNECVYTMSYLVIVLFVSVFPIISFHKLYKKFEPDKKLSDNA